MAEAYDLKQGNISKASLKEDLRRYLDTDTLLYWNPSDKGLSSRQEELWGVALQKFSTKLQLPTLNITSDLFNMDQDTNIIHSFEAFLNDLNDSQLASNDK